MTSDRTAVLVDKITAFLGSIACLKWMSGLIIVWIVLNVVGVFGFRWDPYPFILLNLFFSTQASYAAPLILLSQNRQAERDRKKQSKDLETDRKTLKLLRVQDANTRLIAEHLGIELP